jgi:glutamate racemase
MGKNCRVKNPGKIISASLKDYIERHPELKIKCSPRAACRYFTTGDPVNFKKIGEKFLGRKINNIKKITL